MQWEIRYFFFFVIVVVVVVVVVGEKQIRCLLTKHTFSLFFLLDFRFVFLFLLFSDFYFLSLVCPSMHFDLCFSQFFLYFFVVDDLEGKKNNEE